jgi:hypothetical protein
MKTQRKEYFQTTLLHHLVSEMALREAPSASMHAASSTAPHLPRLEVNEISNARNLLSVAELSHFPLLPDEHELKAFALTEQQLRASTEGCYASTAQRLVPLVEDALQAQLRNYSHFIQADQTTSPLSETESLCWERKTLQTAVRDASEQWCECHRQMHATLEQAIGSCEAVAREWKLGKSTKAENILTEYLSVRAEALTLKCGVLKRNFLWETYTAPRVEALSTIRRELNLQQADVAERQQVRRELLRAYQQAGDELVALAKDVGVLNAEILQKEWAVKELGVNGL